MTIPQRGDVAAGTSVVSTIASFLEPITGILQFVAVVIAIGAGIYAIRVHRKNLK